MSKVKFDVSMSLDGFLAGPNPRFEEPLGDGGEQVHEWMFQTAGWREAHGDDGRRDRPRRRDRSRVVREHRRLRDGPPDVRRRRRRLGRRVVEGLVGRRPALPRAGVRADPPPARALPMEGGTTFHFVTDGIESALEQARAAAGDGDVQIAGGAERGPAVPQGRRRRRVPGARGAHVPGRRRPAVRRPRQRRDQARGRPGGRVAPGDPREVPRCSRAPGCGAPRSRRPAARASCQRVPARPRPLVSKRRPGHDHEHVAVVGVDRDPVAGPCVAVAHEQPGGQRPVEQAGRREGERDRARSSRSRCRARRRGRRPTCRGTWRSRCRRGSRA